MREHILGRAPPGDFFERGPSILEIRQDELFRERVAIRAGRRTGARKGIVRSLNESNVADVCDRWWIAEQLDVQRTRHSRPKGVEARAGCR